MGYYGNDQGKMPFEKMENYLERKHGFFGLIIAGVIDLLLKATVIILWILLTVVGVNFFLSGIISMIYLVLLATFFFGINPDFGKKRR